MNLYFLVEGRRTEKRVYTSWFENYVGMSKISSPDEVQENNFFIISANGYPGILNNHLKNAVNDIELHTNFDYLVIVLDSEEVSESERRNEVVSALDGLRNKLKNTQPYIIIQHHCIETWFLGNNNLKIENPISEELKDYLTFYNVFENDPEYMPVHSNFSVHAHFHEAYLKKIFQENKLVYSKRNPGYAKEADFLQQLEKRHKNCNHLLSMNALFELIKNVMSSQ